MNPNKSEIFLSYCWKNDQIADMIEQYLKHFGNINIHKDKIDIRSWGSIKDYMHSIDQMDFTILLISKEYLESSNCMYEILEVMRDRSYREKIFPVVIDTSIYSPYGRAYYVKHWQEEYIKLSQSLSGISTTNLGRLSEDLKRVQDITSNVAAFLDTVADMNNPQIQDINVAIENKLKEKGILNLVVKENIVENPVEDIFSRLNISPSSSSRGFTDFDKNQFVTLKYQEINSLLQQLFTQFAEQNNIFQIGAEVIDSRNIVYIFYKSGQLITSVKIFLSNMFSSIPSIAISKDTHSYNNNSCNSSYSIEVVNEMLVFKNLVSTNNTTPLTSSEEVVKDIWATYIQPYLGR